MYNCHRFDLAICKYDSKLSDVAERLSEIANMLSNEVKSIPMRKNYFPFRQSLVIIAKSQTITGLGELEINHHPVVSIIGILLLIRTSVIQVILLPFNVLLCDEIFINGFAVQISCFCFMVLSRSMSFWGKLPT